MPSYSIRIDGEDLTFAAGHFLAFSNGQCEPLHGHTYHVTAEVCGPLDNEQCVVDFVTTRQTLKSILAELDHHMLLPTQHRAMAVARTAGMVEVTFGNRRWAFPEDDCRLLPIANTTNELLAQYIAQRLSTILGETVRGVKVAVNEGAGASAQCELP
jgi:6-pyruvoyltetrahydropterin/6-carboxytetrahydropterin synthase